jgi:hypothetical protein
MVWNLTRTDLPDPFIQKVTIKKIEKGSYFDSWNNTSGPFDSKMNINNEDISSIYVNSNSTKGASSIRAGKTYWLKISCLQSPTWFDFFKFSRKFDYELVSIPNQKSKNLTQESLLLTWQTYCFLIAVGLFLLTRLKK